MTSLFLAALLGCGSPSDPTGSGSATGDPTVPSTGTTSTSTTTPAPTTPEPTTTWACRDSVPADQLVGSYPAEELALIDFTATNSDGQPRNQDDLRGHITAIWFYPAAGTAG